MVVRSDRGPHHLAQPGVGQPREPLPDQILPLGLALRRPSPTGGPGWKGFPGPVAAVGHEADSVLSLALRHPEGRDLPAWGPGAHIDLFLPSGRIRQYSLCGSPQDRGEYRIAVLREQAGRGGSAEIRELPLAGTRLMVRGTRNHFPQQGGDLVPGQALRSDQCLGGCASRGRGEDDNAKTLVPDDVAVELEQA